jgi:hypothetical protein
VLQAHDSSLESVAAPLDCTSTRGKRRGARLAAKRSAKLQQSLQSFFEAIGTLDSAVTVNTVQFSFGPSVSRASELLEITIDHGRQCTPNHDGHSAGAPGNSQTSGLMDSPDVLAAPSAAAPDEQQVQKWRAKVIRQLLQATSSLPKPVLAGNIQLFAGVTAAEPLKGAAFEWRAEASCSRRLKVSTSVCVHNFNTLAVRDARVVSATHVQAGDVPSVATEQAHGLTGHQSLQQYVCTRHVRGLKLAL